MRLKQLWNNRIFRTFMQSFISSLLGVISINNVMDYDINVLFGFGISALATALSAIMPLFDVKEEE